MWQVNTLPDGQKIVSGDLSEGMTAVFHRIRGPRIFLHIFSNEAEPRLFDKRYLPILTVDGEHVADFNGLIDFQRQLQIEVCYFSQDRSVGGVILGGNTIILTSFIRYLMTGTNLHIRVFFQRFAMAEYNIALTGLGDALQQAFGVTISQVVTSPAAKATASSPLPPVDRAAIRPMRKDFWRSFQRNLINRYRLQHLR